MMQYQLCFLYRVSMIMSSGCFSVVQRYTFTVSTYTFIYTTKLLHVTNSFGLLLCTQIPDSGASEELPLHIAADRSYLSICELLLAANVDVNIRSSDTLTTALHEAAMNDNLPIIKLLIKYHAKKDITNIHGETPFDLSRNKECRK